MPSNQQSDAARRRSGLWTLAAYMSAIGFLGHTGYDTEDMVSLIYGTIDINSIITIFGIFIASRFVIKQIKQETIKTRYKNFEDHAFGAANNVLAYGIPEGYFVEDNYVNRYIACWRYDEHKDQNNNIVSVHINLLVQPLYKNENFEDMLYILCNENDADRWRYRIVVPKVGNSYGSISQISKTGGIANASNDFYRCIILSMKSLQLFNYDTLMTFNGDLVDTPLKEANDSLLDENVFDRPSESVET